MPHSLTTISIQGDEQPVFEIYADEDHEQTLGFAYDETNAHLWTNASDLLEACKAPELDAAHDELSDLLEDENAENDDIREAAITLCAWLNEHHEKRKAAIAKAETV